jgi:DNA-directed RNA polymerase specialized sigma24 family protein
MADIEQQTGSSLVERPPDRERQRVQPDAVQKDLEAWHLRDDNDAARRALEAITAEWRPRVRRRFSANPDEGDQVLQDALIELVIERGDHPLPRCARAQDISPAAWRAMVLQRFIISQVRRAIPRDRAERATVEGMSPRAMRETLAQERAARGAPSHLRLIEAPREQDSFDGMDALIRADARSRVLLVAAKLPLDERVLVMLVLGADVTPLAEALSAHLQPTWPGATPDAVYERMVTAMNTEANAQARLPPEYCQVVHFGSREAASKDGRRLWTDIETHLRRVLTRGAEVAP